VKRLDLIGRREAQPYFIDAAIRIVGGKFFYSRFHPVSRLHKKQCLQGTVGNERE